MTGTREIRLGKARELEREARKLPQGSSIRNTYEKSAREIRRDYSPVSQHNPERRR